MELRTLGYWNHRSVWVDGDRTTIDRYFIGTASIDPQVARIVWAFGLFKRDSALLCCGRAGGEGHNAKSNR